MSVLVPKVIEVRDEMAPESREVKSINMTKEQLVIIVCTPVVRTSRNSLFFTKDLGSGTVFLPLLPICQAFLRLKTKC